MSKIGLIIGREFNERVRKRSFLIATILMPFVMVGLIGGTMAFFALYRGDVKTVEVIDNSGVIAGHLENTREITYRPSDRSLEDINANHEDVWGALVIPADVVANPAGVKLFTYSSSTVIVEGEISSAIAGVIETEKLKGYDIENLSQILAEVKTNVTLDVTKVGEDGEEERSSSTLAIVLAYILGFLMYGIVLAYGGMVMSSVIEEKNSKVLEVVVSSVRPFQLMMGKIIGIALVALTQFAIWGVLIGVGSAAVMRFMVPRDIMAAAQSMQAMTGSGAMGGMTVDIAGMDMADLAGARTGGATDPNAGVTGGATDVSDEIGAVFAENPGMSGEMGAVFAENPELLSALGGLMDVGYILRLLIAFVFYFLGGYLLYAAMFAAVGSAVDNVQDAQQFQMPITMFIIVGFIGMFQAMQDPTSPIAFWMSIVPFTSPLVMMARIPYGVPVWEIALSAGLLVVTFVAMVWLAGKIYRVGIFMYGKKPSFRELAKWITYKS